MADRPVRQLRLIGRTRDGAALVLEAAGERFVLPVDDGVLAAMGAPAPEPVEPSWLTPRDIQARIRKGESATEIAVAAGVDVAAVARFEGPVLAEREHQVELAGRALMRGITLSDRVAAHRARDAGHEVASEPPRWDSWLREDGASWAVQVVWPDGGVALWAWRPGTGTLQALDAGARTVSDEPVGRSDDLEAVLRPLRSGPARAAPAPAEAPMAPPAPRSRRAVVPSWEEITLGRPDPT